LNSSDEFRALTIRSHGMRIATRLAQRGASGRPAMATETMRHMTIVGGS
jgi:hypothetical protein